MPGHPETTTLDVHDIPQARGGTGSRLCSRCRTGDCERCTRVGCFHACPSMRKFGLASSSDGVEHGAPKPGGGR